MKIILLKQIKKKKRKVLQKEKKKYTQPFVNIKSILILIAFTMLISCEKETQEIPSYIKINEYSLYTTASQGSNSENISDIWVYADDQLIGTFELPATIPILLEGETTLKIFSGIKDNGISEIRIRYPFYDLYEETVILKKDSTINISPNFTNKPSATLEIDDFESPFWNLDTTIHSQIDFQILEENNHKYASAILDNDNVIFEVSTKDFEDLPQQGSPIYMEIDYQSNSLLLIGAYINYPFSIINKDLLWITPKENWNKIYINLTQTVSEAINNESIKFYMKLVREDTSTTSWVNFDNIKIIY